MKPVMPLKMLAEALNNGGVIRRKKNGSPVKVYRLVQPGIARHLLLSNPHSSAAKSLNDRIVAKELAKNIRRLLAKSTELFKKAIEVEDKKERYEAIHLSIVPLDAALELCDSISISCPVMKKEVGAMRSEIGCAKEAILQAYRNLAYEVYRFAEMD